MFKYLWIFIICIIYVIWAIASLVDIVRTLIEHIRYSKNRTERLQKELGQVAGYSKQTFFEEFRDYLDELESYTWVFFAGTIFSLFLWSLVDYLIKLKEGGVLQ